MSDHAFRQFVGRQVQRLQHRRTLILPGKWHRSNTVAQRLHCQPSSNWSYETHSRNYSLTHSSLLKCPLHTKHVTRWFSSGTLLCCTRTLGKRREFSIVRRVADVGLLSESGPSASIWGEEDGGHGWSLDLDWIQAAGWTWLVVESCSCSTTELSETFW